MKTIDKYQRIIDELINKSFDNLKGKKVIVYEEKNTKFSAYTTKSIFNMKIKVHPRLKKYSSIQLKGLFAHELCHLEHFCNLGFFGKLFRDFMVAFSKNYRINEEKETDRKSIKKGYAKGLYLQRLSRLKTNDKNVNNLKIYYLTPEEIKSYAKSIGKWQ